MPLLLVALYWYLLYLRRTYACQDGADEHYCAVTDDGFSLAVCRYRPAAPPKGSPPLLLVHGLGANRFNFDAGDECSLARFLAAQGFDCWVVDLRGCGESRSAARRWTWTFEHHVDQDVPAVLDLIARVTGNRQVSWIGHSMGGMLLYAYLLRHGQARVHRGVTLGAPARFSPRDDGLRRLVALQRLLKLLPQLPVAPMGRLATPLLGLVTPAFVQRQVNVDNVDWRLLRKALYNSASHLAPGVLLQFLNWMEHGDFHAANGYSYTRNLSTITTPVLVMAGRGDRLVPAHDVKIAYEAVSSPEKRYVELCCEAGFSSDYGHIDLIFGRHARDEVFPHIATWLA